MQLKKLMKDLVDAVDGAGREFKTGFSGAFRKRGGRHRADADRVRRTDRDGADRVPTHRDGADRVPTHRAEKPTSHAKKYDILTDVSRGIETHGHVPRHAKPDYNLMQDLGRSVGKSIRDIPGDIVDEVKGVPKKVPGQLVEELYEDAIGQDSPDKYGRQGGDMRFLAPASEASDLSGLGQGDLETRFGMRSGALDGATIEIEEIPDSRFVSVKIDYPGRD
ncbi:hypothetical protein KEC56_04335 [Microbacterium sp. YMB-B2]|uniref:Uncharacterized protein n=1 Tax=Microbacterium tenebrionis TaxID=2830665 RepID=A0A9X1RZH1_9MICO|nr:hypothetical protein [Microbacterium tenebrionis]MCC2028754.1 hypothetical protein [Microbacterium tenebrionis]